MTKNILLAATAVAALGFAGGAAAQVNISSAKVSGVTLGVNTTTSYTTNTFYSVASESTGTEANRTTTTATGDNAIASALRVGRFDAGAGGTNYTATITLNGATFATAVLNSRVTVTGSAGACVVSAPTVVSGGAAGQNTATVVFNVGSTCSTTTPADYAPNGVTFDVPFIKDAAATTVSATIGYAAATTGAAFGGAPATGQLVRTTAGYSVYARPALANGDPAVRTSFALPGYTALATGADYDAIIGSVAATTNTGGATAAGSAVFADMKAAALPAITGTVSVSGNLAVLTPSSTAPVTLVVNTGQTTAATAAAVVVAPSNITVTKNGSSAVTAPQAFSATVTPTLVSNTLVTTPGAVTASLETVGQQGTSFVAPWVQSANASYNTVIRVSNSGSAVSLPVRLSLSSPAAAADRTECTVAELPKLASIPANGELSINSTDLTTCFGAFTRGDVRVTIPAQATNLTAKLRIVNPGNIVAEQSLGAISQGVAIVQ